MQGFAPTVCIKLLDARVAICRSPGDVNEFLRAFTIVFSLGLNEAPLGNRDELLHVRVENVFATHCDVLFMQSESPVR
jgi:hypothetical protein